MQFGQAVITATDKDKKECASEPKMCVRANVKPAQ